MQKLLVSLLVVTVISQLVIGTYSARCKRKNETSLLVVQPSEDLVEALNVNGLEWAVIKVPASKARSGIDNLSSDELLELLHHRTNQDDSLGTAVYLPNVNILDTLVGGRNIFSGMKDDSIIVTNVLTEEKTSVYYESTEKFMKSIGSEASISGSYGAVSASLKSSYNSISGGEEKMTSLTINTIRKSKMKAVNKNKVALLPLNPQFLSDFQSLPSVISQPGVSSGWLPFQRFMEKWGSHYISTLYTGSLLQQWSTSKSSNRYSQHEFKAQACLKLEGLTSEIDACAGVSTESKKESLKLEMNDKLFVKGGTEATRAALYGSRTRSLVNRFMDEGLTSDVPIQYKFTPIWDVMFDRFSLSSKESQVARNLQAYYDGFKGFNCPDKNTSNNVALQYFAAYPDQYGKHFECRRACEGCKNNDDCHIGAGGAKCYCYGPSCIVLGGDGRPTNRGGSSGGTWDGVNNSCKYKLVRCNCHGYDGDKACVNGEYAVLWSQSDSTRIIDVDVDEDDVCSCESCE